MTDKQESDKQAQFTRKKIEAYSYGLADQIGKGYSSRVYRGRHDHTEENVAVKVIDLKMLKNDINRELLYSQIEILKELKECSHVLRLFDIFSTKNNTYIITELCSSDLSKLIKQGLSQSQAIPYMQNIIKGYLQFHAKRIVHRDLKPANILVTACDHVKIADFGFAIKMEALSKSSKYNVGSPLYMAPESLRKNDYSYKSDIWALGVIFYEMLFSDTPWRAKNEKDLLRKIESQSIEIILSGKNITPTAKEFLVKCLKVDKHARMGPEQLQEFNLTPNSHILTEKVLNTNQKIPHNESFTFTTALQENKSFKIDRSIEDAHKKGRPHNQNNQSTHNHFKTYHGEGGHIKLKTEQAQVLRSEPLAKEQKRLISKMLISEVHFCRFLFKLLQKIKESSSIGLLQSAHIEDIQHIHSNYATIIRRKIEQLLAFKQHNFLKCVGYREYKWTSDCEKLIKIAREYSDRYKNDLQEYWEDDHIVGFPLQPTNRLIKVLYQLLERQVCNMQSPEEEIGVLSREVVILDYLVTAQQLLEMIATNPEAYERFARKSRIEEIVQGRTVQIQYELYGQIMQRVRQIMQKRQFVSFGADLMAA